MLAADLSKKRTREGLSEDYAHCLRSSLHHLLSVPGVPKEVEKEIAATAHDQLVLRMCTVVQDANNVVHPLLVDRLDSLDLTGFAEDDCYCFIQGTVESLTSVGGVFLLRRFLGDTFNPPLRSRVIWLHRDDEHLFKLELEDDSYRQVISDGQSLRGMRAYSYKTYWVEELERLVKTQKLLDMLRDLAAVLVVEVRGKPQILMKVETKEAKCGSVWNCRAALTAGDAIREMLGVANLVGTILCYLQFDFKF